MGVVGDGLLKADFVFLELFLLLLINPCRGELDGSWRFIMGLLA